MVTYFENLTVGLHVVYILNTHVKFHADRMLFISRFINYFFLMHNFRLQKHKI